MSIFILWWTRKGARITLNQKPKKYQIVKKGSEMIVSDWSRSFLGFGLGINSEFIRPENLKFCSKEK